MLAATARNAGARGVGKGAVASSDSTPKTLPESGLTRDESSRYQGTR